MPTDPVIIGGVSYPMVENDGQAQKIPLINPILRALAETLITAPTFIAPTLLNSWVNFGAPTQNAGYTLHQGMVILRGTVKSGTVGSPIFTLPVGYRPAGNVGFAIVSNALFGYIIIESDGDVVLATGFSNLSVYLNCSFVPT